MNSFIIALGLIILMLCLSILIYLIVLLRSISIEDRRKRASKSRLVVRNVSRDPEVKGCRKVALLIDTDNTNCDYIGKIMNKIGQVGDYVIVYSCLYGLSLNQSKWTHIADEYRFEQKYLTTYLKGKNSTDFRIVIDCMDLLNYDIDVFIICSSDSDFSAIANRIKENGRIVVGMGMDNTPDIFRKSCTLIVMQMTMMTMNVLLDICCCCYF